jgi:glycine cleavage system H protein
MPQDLRYSKTHEWVRLEKDPSGSEIAVVGLTAFALELLTDLVHVELPPVGRQVGAGQPFGEIESVKAVSDLYSPVNGEVVAANSALADNLEHLADDPYGAGWFIKIKIADRAGLGELLGEAAYKKQCEQEQH